jgi:hypothetical protein
MCASAFRRTDAALNESGFASSRPTLCLEKASGRAARSSAGLANRRKVKLSSAPPLSLRRVGQSCLRALRKNLQKVLFCVVRGSVLYL